MKKIVKAFLLTCLFLGVTPLLFATTPQLTAAMKENLQEDIKRIEKWAADPVIIDAVKAQNSEGISLEEIKQRDEAWQEVRKLKSKPNDLMKKNYNHIAGNWLRQKNKKAKGRYPESFLTDNQGANVAVSKFTSDYWQGDEGKWKNAIKNGGVVFVGQPEFDKSTYSTLVQVSVPVKDGSEVIGVLVVGVKYNKK